MIPKKQDIVISDRTEGMVESSASYYQESQLFFYIINAKARGYDLVNEKQDDLALQLSPLTATWGLIFWEQSVGLPMLPNSDYATRRPKVLARLQNYENFGAPMIHRIAEAYGEKIRVYIDPAECLVTIVFQRGVPTFLEEFKKAVDNIIHAHLGTEYKFEYIITGGLEMLTQYHVYGYNVPEAGASAICGTLPFTATEGRLYSASLGVSGKVDTVLRDYDQTGTIASGPLPFVSTEGRVYRTVIAEAVDGTYTIDVSLNSGFTALEKGVGNWYVASVKIPAREYDYQPTGETDDEGYDILEEVALDVNMRDVTLCLWGIPDMTQTQKESEVK